MNYKDIYANANTKTPLERKERDLQYRKMDIKSVRFLIVRDYIPALQTAVGSLCSVELYKNFDKGQLVFGCGAIVLGITSAGLLVYSLKNSRDRKMESLRRSYSFLKKDYKKKNKEYKVLKKKLK